MLIAACKCGHSSPCDSYVLVTPSLDGKSPSAAKACSLEHATVATMRRVTAMRSSHQLPMTVLRWQQQHAHWAMQVRLERAARQLCARHDFSRWRCCVGSSSMLIGAIAATVRRATAMRSSRHLSRVMLRGQQQHAHRTMHERLQCAARQLRARHTIFRWQCCVVNNSMLVGPCVCGYSTPCDSHALVTPSLDGDAASVAKACSLEHWNMLLRLQCAARQLCAHHTSCG